MNFCIKCGSCLAPDLKFCTNCGVSVASEGQPAESSTSTPPDPMAPSPSVAEFPSAATEIPQGATAPNGWQPTTSPPQPRMPVSKPAANSRSGRATVIVSAFAVLFLIAILGLGGLIYAGCKLKQKATAVLHQTTTTMQHTSEPERDKPGSPENSPPDNTAGPLSNLSNLLGGDDDGDLVQSFSDKDPVEPCPAAPYPSQSAARIPLQPGTVITTAWGIKYEDVESRIELGSGTPSSIAMTNSTGAFRLDEGNEAEPSSHTDSVCNADLGSASTYVTVVTEHMPHLIHGVTRLRLSDKSFGEIKSSGKTNLTYLDVMDYGDERKPTHDGGLFTRVEPDDVPYPLIVNDQRVTLPAIHLAGITNSIGKDPRPKSARPHNAAADIYVIDDRLDPLVLLWKEKSTALHDDKFRVEVVKVDFVVPRPVNSVEKQLKEQKRAVTYGIDFDFNKDTIKQESEPVLKQIVQAMMDNPTWKLTVEGHTDNIGGDAYNLDLSKRRAAAVKQALVTRYHIAPDRLSADGFGASSPIDTNDTLEGRARNRRVELTRE